MDLPQGLLRFPQNCGLDQVQQEQSTHHAGHHHAGREELVIGFGVLP